jgi:imidazolonepropionase-like amidohydrolase
VPGTPPPAEPRGLSEAQRRELRRLLHGELRDAWRAAVEAGASEAELRELLDERRRKLRSSESHSGESRPGQPDSGGSEEPSAGVDAEEQ